ncbi:hypothetical protein WME76_21005 [Sorangium sp. So ce119]|uniref:hypothetical protein n=1 Tax=Sorangium sp. So ce119 TaxID=3133279 RepID=UPI003F6150D3
MSEFVFLYRGKDWTTSPAEMQQRMQKWSAWMKELGEKGHLKNPGHPSSAPASSWRASSGRSSGRAQARRRTQRKERIQG